MSKKLSLFIISVAVILGGAFVLFFGTSLFEKTENPQTVSEPIVRLEYGIAIDSFDVEVYTIQKNDILSKVLYSLGATSENVAQVSMLGTHEFDSRTMKAGNRCKAFYAHTTQGKNQLCYFVYEKSPTAYAVISFQDTVCVVHGEKEIQRRVKRSEAEITSSLWNAAQDNGINPILALNLSDIYAWTIDFFGLQPGDKFSALYDELYIDTTFIGIGQIYAAEFYHADKNYYGFFFEQDNAGGYWDENGTSLKRAFLKAPLKFSRISSTFSMSRRHPVLRIIRPHTGVDYAAPAGTPVMSIGEGTIIQKGYRGGGGHTVKIRHNSVYTTAYLHLSKYGEGIKEGSRVRQGQVIGYVGSTGLSTGAHLDFRVWKNGKAVNPLTIESPPVEPISFANKAAFDSVSNNYLKLLKGNYLL